MQPLENITNAEASLETQIVNPFPPPIPVWTRLLARTLDMALETYAVFFLAALAVLQFNPNFMAWVNESYNVYVLNFLLQPFVCLLNAAMYTVFGNTLGKALLGFKVTKETGERLTFTEYFKRNYQVWFIGNAYCIPVYCIIANLTQYNNLKKYGHTSYDIEAGYVFTGKVPSKKRTLAIIVSLIVLMGIADSLSDANVADEMYEMEEQTTVL